MEKREAYNFKEVLILYNFALVILSAWMMHEVSANCSFCFVLIAYVNFEFFIAFIAQFIASILDIPNFNFFCEPVPYVRGDKRQNRVSDLLEMLQVICHAVCFEIWCLESFS